MFCPKCGKQVSQTDRYCGSCGGSLQPLAKPPSGGQRKSIPAAWVEEKTKLLKERLPKDVQEKPFYPDDLFYLQYYADPLASLHYKAQVIFSLLKIEPSGCVIDFCDEKEFHKYLSGDTAGVYTTFEDEEGRKKELILINSKHKDDTFAVGAILAHEMMHLYLSRLNLRLQDTQENELLTDLATINTGLPILILNGMSYSSAWWLTIIMAVFGWVYISSEELAFGYFKPGEYGSHAVSYLNEKHIKVEDIIGYLTPSSRHFVPHRPSIKGRASTSIIQLLEKRHRRSNIIKGAIVAAVLVPVLAWVTVSVVKDQYLEAQIRACKAEVTLLETKINGNAAQLKQLDEELAKYKEGENVEGYNSLVEPYNSLLKEVDAEIPQYEAKRAVCNRLIDEYNKRK